jgi:hypothetical protein
LVYHNADGLSTLESLLASGRIQVDTWTFSGVHVTRLELSPQGADLMTRHGARVGSSPLPSTGERRIRGFVSMDLSGGKETAGFAVFREALVYRLFDNGWAPWYTVRRNVLRG